jgi:hypothetical protein
MKKNILLILAALSFHVSFGQLPVKIKKLEKEKKFEVTIGGKIFTNFYFPGTETLKKQVLYPIYSPNGKIITRGWPIDPLPGERVDHPHHVGVWLNYEDANGHDFWNNSNAVDHSKRKYGTVVHEGDVNIKTYPKGGASLTTKAVWQDVDSKPMLKETTTYEFRGDGKTNIVDRITTLTAVVETVLFKDVKDGLFAIRVNRNLEHPAEKAEIFTDASGIATKVPVLDNTGVTGKYRNAEGVLGEKTWGLRSPWVTLEGQMNAQDVSVTILDHKKNINYPSYWHTRGYGLFSVNPLGENVFTNGQKSTNLTLKKGEKVTFRYRLMVSDAHFSKEQIDKVASDFNKKY